MGSAVKQGYCSMQQPNFLQGDFQAEDISPPDRNQMSALKIYSPKTNHKKDYRDTIEPMPPKTFYCPIHSFDPSQRNSNVFKSQGYPQMRQLGNSRVRANSFVQDKCTCAKASSKGSNEDEAVESSLKKQRHLIKQKQGTLMSSGGQNDADEAEINALFNSDKSCRQLFSEKKRNRLSNTNFQ